MKILFFIDSFPAGGKERRLVELMKGLKARPGIEFELVMMSRDLHYKEVNEMNVKVHQVIRKTKKDFSILSKFYRICKDFKPDIVHCWDSMTAVYLVPVLKVLKIKMVNGMVADAPEKQNYGNKTWLRARLTFPFSHVIIGNSLAGLAAYRAPKSKSVCIYNGFNFQRTENIKTNELVRQELTISTRFVIGMVASFSVFKDYDTYFKAAQMVLDNRSDVTFLAIGDNTDSDGAKNHIRPEFSSHFRLLGRRTGVESFVNSMDICVLSTFTEGISNSILEYMALSKPVIATEGGGTNEILVDGDTGYLVSRSDPEELAEKMMKLLEDEELRTKMGVSGRRRVAEYFSIEKMVNDFVENYDRISMGKTKMSSKQVENVR